MITGILPTGTFFSDQRSLAPRLGSILLLILDASPVLRNSKSAAVRYGKLRRTAKKLCITYRLLHEPSIKATLYIRV